MTNIRPVYIHAIGTALPEQSIVQSEALEHGAAVCGGTEKQQRSLAVLYRRSGVSVRHSVLLGNGAGTSASQSFYPPRRDEHDGGPTTSQRMARYQEEAPPLAERATRIALESADIPAARITHLVTVSCTGFFAPGLDVELIRRLGLSPHVGRVHVGFMGCHGAINGLRVAQGLALADPDACVLLCAVELSTLHLYYGWHPERIVANALFADGAAACVVSAGRPEAAARRLLATGSILLPGSEDAMSWHIGDHGFVMGLSPRVPELIHRHLRPWLAEWLARFDLTIDAIVDWAIHPGGPRIVSSVEEALSLPTGAADASRTILDRCGNMSSPTVLFILEELRRQHRRPECTERSLAAHRGRDGPSVALAFGPGLTAEVALLDGLSA